MIKYAVLTKLIKLKACFPLHPKIYLLYNQCLQEYDCYSEIVVHFQVSKVFCPYGRS